VAKVSRTNAERQAKYRAGLRVRAAEAGEQAGVILKLRSRLIDAEHENGRLQARLGHAQEFFREVNRVVARARTGQHDADRYRKALDEIAELGVKRQQAELKGE